MEAAQVAPERVTAILRMPSELKDALIRAAGETSLNDYACGVLARRFDLPYESSGRPAVVTSTKTPKGEAQVILRMPDELHFRIGQQALVTRSTQNTLAVSTLAEEVGYSYTPPKRGAPRGARRKNRG